MGSQLHDADYDSFRKGAPAQYDYLVSGLRFTTIL